MDENRQKLESVTGVLLDSMIGENGVLMGEVADTAKEMYALRIKEDDVSVAKLKVELEQKLAELDQQTKLKMKELELANAAKLAEIECASKKELEDLRYSHDYSIKSYETMSQEHIEYEKMLADKEIARLETEQRDRASKRETVASIVGETVKVAIPSIVAVAATGAILSFEKTGRVASKAFALVAKMIRF